MASLIDTALGRPSAERAVLAIVSVHPSGIGVTEIQEHELWRRYGGRSSSPDADTVMRAIKRLQERRLVQEHRKKIRLTANL